MPNNVFEGLDEILARQKEAENRSRQEHEEILEAINKANSQSAQVDQIQRTVDRRNQVFSLKNFLSRSTHEYMWLGTYDDFDKEKTISVFLIIASIISMIVCTIVTTASFGMYSTFTLFENIWLLLALFVLKYTCMAKKNYSVWEYSSNSYEEFEVNSDGVLMRGYYKRKYRWSFVLACIAFVMNALSAWVLVESATPLLVTILELLTMALNMFTAYKVTDFFYGYGPMRFTGMNEAGTEKVVLIFDTTINKLYTEEDYLKTFPFMI